MDSMRCIREKEKTKLFSKKFYQKGNSDNNTKAQSAMEYLMTYGWAILIIAVILAALDFLGIFNGSTLVSTACLATPGYLCSNPILAISNSLQPDNLLLFTFKQDTGQTLYNVQFACAATANSSTGMPNTRNAANNGFESFTGINTISSGSSVDVQGLTCYDSNGYPISNLPIGSTFGGSIWISYTTLGSSTPQYAVIAKLTAKVELISIVSTSLSSSTNTSTTIVQTPSNTPNNVITYIPITLTNLQSIPTPTPFQQMVNISEFQISGITYNGASANFEYFYPNGTIIPAWIENNNSGNLVTWLYLKNGISADNSILIYLGFTSSNTNLLSASGTIGIGEAPLLSPTYAEYDDGVQIFNIYANFQGISPPAGWYASQSAGFSGGSVGYRLDGSSCSGCNTEGSIYYANAKYPVNGIIAETSFYTNAVSDVVAQYFFNNGAYLVNWGPSASSATTGYASYIEFCGPGCTASPGSSINYADNSGIIGLKGGAFPGESWEYLYVQSVLSPDTYNLNYAISSKPVNSPVYKLTNTVSYQGAMAYIPSSGNFGLYGGDGSGTSNYISVLWTRVRALPPNNVMPSVSYNSQSTPIIKPVSMPSEILHYAPIEIVNSQSTPTPAQFQQIITIPEQQYKAYINFTGASANFEYFYPNGTIIPAWIENNNSGNLVTWIKLSNSILSNSNTIIYLGFAGTNNLLSSSGTTGIGEAPQLPCGTTPTSSCATYAEYDDGAKVFNNYWNFAGSSLPIDWIATSSSYSIDNGITLNNNNVGSLYVYYGSFNIVSANVFDSYGYSTARGSGNGNTYSAGLINGGTASSSLGAGTAASGSDYTGYTWSSSAGESLTDLGAPSSTQEHVFTLYQTSSTADWQLDYGTLFSSTASYGAATSTSISIYSAEPTSGQAFVQWIRIRNYPPNGAMPNVTFGSVS